MKKFVWLIGLLRELCDATNSGCCGINERVCIKCCPNYHMNNGTCQECPPGYSGDKCNIKCVYPWYGSLCGSSCNNDPNNCSSDDCHPALGCQSHDLKTSTTLNKDSQVGFSEFIQGHREKTTNGLKTSTLNKDLQVGISEFIQGHREKTTNGSGLFTNMPVSPSRKQINYVVTRHMATIYINTPAREVLGTDVNSKDALLLVSIVKSLGYTLGVSLLVILGLICLLICKRRRESMSDESMPISQPSEQEFRLLSASSHQNVDSSLVASRNSINSPLVYQDHSEIVLAREAGNMDGTESVGESRNTTMYMHMKLLSDQNTDHTTSVDNPYYAEMGSKEA